MEHNIGGSIAMAAATFLLLTITLAVLIGSIKDGGLKAGVGVIFTLLAWLLMMDKVIVPTHDAAKNNAIARYYGMPIPLTTTNSSNRIFNPLGAVLVGRTLLFYEPDGRMYDLGEITYADELSPKVIMGDVPTASYITFNRGGKLYLGRHTTDSVETSQSHQGAR